MSMKKINDKLKGNSHYGRQQQDWICQRICLLTTDNNRQIISPSDETTKEINGGIAQGCKKYWSLKEIMKSKDLSNHIKKKIFETCILSVLTYGCETWSTTLPTTGKG